MEVKIIDNSEVIKKAKDEAVERALFLVGQTAERHAKERCPVDTGRLKNSITYATSEYSGRGSYTDDYGKSYNDATAKSTPEKNAVYIGTNVEYAKKQEEGDYQHQSGASHFLRDAATTHGDEYKRIVEIQLNKE